MKAAIKFSFIILLFTACSSETAKSTNDTNQKKDSVYEENFVFVNSQDTVIQNGEQITRHKNGVIDKQGMMKNGKRDGLWKSFYEDGTPWSETTFKDGIKNGKTTTWHPNGQKRYDGFYTNDTESGKWTFYDEKGNITQQGDYESGKWIFYYENGKISQKRDDKSGKSTYYDENGKVIPEEDYDQKK